jgi:transcriptional regulator with XRE-family HTH domain
LEKNRNLEELGNQIRSLRKIKGLSQEKLAHMAEIDRSYMGSIERGERNISLLTIIKIAKCLECEVATLTKGLPYD